MSRKIVFFGECMVELSKTTLGQFQQSFAGDMYNASVYLKRYIGDEADVSFCTAVGHDQLSQDMVSAFRSEQINDDLVFQSDLNPGLYMIQTDDQGERSFQYWRSNSAARQFMACLKNSPLHDNFPKTDMLVFSGITLAILTDSDRKDFLSFLANQQKSGAQLVFDPNYRPLLWQDVESARHWLNKAYELSDILLPGFEEEQHLFDRHDIDQILDHLSKNGPKEIILKADEDGVFGQTIKGERFQIPHQPAEKVIDTTAAGDSFLGTYIGARLKNSSPTEAVSVAASFAREVVGHKGAIMPIET